MAVDRDLVRGSLDLMILAVLMDGPAYGYSIQKRLRAASGNLVRLQAGTLYPLLHRLEDNGLIASRWDATTGRDRKWYAMTKKGKRRLQHRAAVWHQYMECIHRVLGPVLDATGPSHLSPASGD
jgi:PadR family transcriptional regulator, regulatory protein PadR